LRSEKDLALVYYLFPFIQINFHHKGQTEGAGCQTLTSFLSNDSRKSEKVSGFVGVNFRRSSRRCL